MSKPNPKPISYAGAFPRSLDAKNRATIPAIWLDGGPDEFHAIPHSSGDFLMVMPPDEFDSIAAGIKQSGSSMETQRNLIRQFYSQARAVSADAQGRILLPEEQCDMLKLKGEIVLVGVHSRFEIWSAKRWADFNPKDSTNYREVAKQFGL